MGLVLDYTFRIDPVALKAAGVVGVCRYLKPDSAPTYRIGLAEYRELVAAGIAVTLNWEFDAYDWLGGAARGQAHAADAVRQARALGYPAGRVIVGSADFDMTRAQWDTSAASYARAFAATVRAGGYRPGVYGPWDVLGWVRDAKIMDAFWQAGMSTAFSGGRNAAAWPGAHLRQRGHRTVAGQDCDWNEILIPNWGNDMLKDESLGDQTKSADHTGPRNGNEALSDLYALRLVLIGQKTLAEAGYGPKSPLAKLLALADAGAPDPAALAAALAPLLSDHLGVEVSQDQLVAALQSDAGQAALVAAANKAEDS